MRAALPSLAAALLAACALAGEAAPPNLLPNPGFEGGRDAPAGWTTRAQGGASFARDALVRRSGQASASIAAPQGTRETYPAFSVRRERVLPGEEYRAEVHIRSDGLAGGAGAYLALETLDWNGQRVGIAHSRAEGGEEGGWRRLVAAAEVPEGASRLVLHLILNGRGRAWFDDASLVRTKEAPRVIRKVTFSVETKSAAEAPFLGFGSEWDPYVLDPERGATTEADWKLNAGRMKWMRPGFVRVMMLAKWCSRGGGRFDWESPPMKQLYRHLDVCQEAGITVVLTDWGCERNWVRIPGVADTADPRYAEVIGTYLDHLLRTRKYTCIRHFVLVNEPNHEVGKYEGWAAGVRNVARELAARKLDGSVRIAGSDASGDWRFQNRAVDELHAVLGAYDVHWYCRDAQMRSGEIQRTLAGLKAHALKKDPKGAAKPFFMGEAGLIDGAYPPAGNRGIGTFEYGLFMADYAVQAANAGLSGVSAWNTCDAEHKDFRWGLWADRTGKWELRPWFHVWSLLCRYVRPGAAVLRVSAEKPSPDVRLLAARAGGDAWTFCIVNRGTADADVTLRAPGAGAVLLRRYDYVREGRAADERGFPKPVAELKADLNAGLVLACPAESAVLLTSVRE